MNVHGLSQPLVGADKNKTSALTAAIQSTLLFFCNLFPVTFLMLLLHEGGHALAYIYLGGRLDVLYAHPFAMGGYARVIPWENTVLGDSAGNALELTFALALFILFWKRRSIKTLPLVLLFPWSGLVSAFAVLDLMNKSGDYYNLIRETGIPAIYFYILNIALALIGIFFFVALLPLFGIAPKQWRVLIVLPAGILLWGLVGLAVANLTIPGAPINTRYHLGESLLNSAKMYSMFSPAIGFVLALVYITIFRWIEPRLPRGLRTETVALAWKDLLLPAVIAAACSLVGLILIT